MAAAVRHSASVAGISCVQPVGAEQTPPVQTRPDVQACPQVPQSLAEVWTSAHPSGHKVKEASHDRVPQRPKVHEGVPLLTEHTCPQDPQLLTSLASRTQAPPQASYPLSHPPTTHVPEVHAGDPCAIGEQACPHAPQLSISDETGSLHPLWRSVSLQLAQPSWHELAHCPSEQAALVTCVALHVAPHDPQLSGSLWTFVQLPPQSVSPGGHAHALATQAVVGASHRRPQPPQLRASVAVATQTPPQFVSPSAGQGFTQLPAWQAGAAWGHTLPQAPQFDGSVASVTQVPLQVTLPWSVQGSMQAPLSQVGIAMGQTCPQLPQLLASEVTSAHCPPHSAKPCGVHVSGT
jgi:hypothetical protein